jgi:hypothetical protein
MLILLQKTNGRDPSGFPWGCAMTIYFAGSREMSRRNYPVMCSILDSFYDYVLEKVGKNHLTWVVSRGQK